ncbi:unnamed protein product [Dibothriocephalus latus]|uniref:Uncharacterized protein n=1 Tax=Dibothriocephalus latus TaxID=60516 RepID=A0A3P7M3H5_DIBLA|nr:unnamed protein product [Dibothriocephalus latus]
MIFPSFIEFRLPSFIVPIRTGNNAFNELQKLHAKYGPTVSFRLCGNFIVVFSDMEGIRAAALERRSWIGRHTMLTNHILAGGRGISNYDGENAISLRRSLVRAIHTLLPSKVNAKAPQPDFESAKRLAATTEVLNSYADLQLDSKLDTECSKLINFLTLKAGEPVTLKYVVEVKFRSFLLTYSSLARRIAGVEDIWKRYHRVTDVLGETVDAALREQKLPSNCLLGQIMGIQGKTIVRKFRHLVPSVDEILVPRFVRILCSRH